MLVPVLPSELAQMENDQPVDVFDLNLVEKRLLYFKRDQQVDIRRKRRFHVVFWSPERFDYRPSVVPVRWPYLLLGVIFDVVRFFRDELSITNCPHSPKSPTARPAQRRPAQYPRLDH